MLKFPTKMKEITGHTFYHFTHLYKTKIKTDGTYLDSKLFTLLVSLTMILQVKIQHKLN